MIALPVPGVNNICVVGAGNMGHQIALCFAIAGYKVKCTDVNPEILQKAEKFADTYLPERVAKGKMSEEQAKAARANISFTGDLKEAAHDADVVVEAILEKLDLKLKVFAQLDEICPPHTILATNSSFIVSSKIAPATKRPEKVCNMHFFNPALVMKLVEVVKGPHTAEETARTIYDLAADIGKVPVLLQKEIYGFLVNRIVAAINHEALYIYDMGVASYEDIDKAVVYALGHPMGPFRLMDLTGIDLAYYIGMERYQQTGDPAHKPSPIVVEKFVKKEWGQKTGKGFYDYSKK
ncbi:3-hydroxyacyl-CoA dehydrogenase family protein [Desulfurispora thermophila]|uniref:3-hydroxyacyl-CoA dehydrogenase family protein n=1 Tax=Desulfurispora thermophila TaxID=265470 RepID=UPI000527AA06